MAAFQPTLPDEPLEVLVITKVSNQVYPEIELEPSAIHLDGIARKWQVANYDANFKPLVFNKDFLHPQITKGWNEFQTANNLPANVEVQIGCYSPRFFRILSHKDVTNPTELKPYHSRSEKPNDTLFFDMMITAENVSSPRFVLPAAFGEFLRVNLLYYLTLCGDNGQKTKIRLQNHTDSLNTQLGNSWNEFSNSQNFAIGNVIRFKFDLTRLNGKCSVYKISN